MPRHGRGRRGWMVCALALVACDWTAETSTGLDSMIRVGGAQAFRGSISDPPVTGLATATVVPANYTIFAGATGKSIKGIIGPDANAVALGVAGDTEYWRVPALSQDPTDPHSYRFDASFSISREVTNSPLLTANGDGTRTLPLTVRAIDPEGRFGPPFVQPLVLDDTTLRVPLVVALEWDSPADLDLHVLVPSPVDPSIHTEVWAKHRSADKGNPATNTPPDGVLDLDSNAGCQGDNHGLEQIVWTATPPTGRYIVRVAAASLCTVSSSAWHAFAKVPVGSKADAAGVLTLAATRTSAGEGAGITAFEFDYP